VSKPQDASVQPLLAALASYLDTHPRAADTLEGIARWWLPEPFACDSRPEDLARAVEQLTAQGRLHSLASPDGQTIYVNQDQHRLH
jgi:hypothetical protein